MSMLLEYGGRSCDDDNLEVSDGDGDDEMDDGGEAWTRVIPGPHSSRAKCALHLRVCLLAGAYLPCTRSERRRRGTNFRCMVASGH